MVDTAITPEDTHRALRQALEQAWTACQRLRRACEQFPAVPYPRGPRAREIAPRLYWPATDALGPRDGALLPGWLCVLHHVGAETRAYALHDTLTVLRRPQDLATLKDHARLARALLAIARWADRRTAGVTRHRQECLRQQRRARALLQALAAADRLCPPR